MERAFEQKNLKLFGFKMGDTVAQWLALSPHSLCLFQEPFWLEFTCCPHVCVGFLWVLLKTCLTEHVKIQDGHLFSRWLPTRA